MADMGLGKRTPDTATGGDARTWDPWAPRTGDRAAPSSAPPVGGASKPAGGTGLPPAGGTGLPPAPGGTSSPLGGPVGSGRGVPGMDLPASPPGLGNRPVTDEHRMPGSPPAPPTSWPAPRVVADPGATPPRRRGALVAFCAFLVGATLVGAVFASYALGDRRDDDSVEAGATTTTADPGAPKPTLDIRKILDVAQPSVVSIQTGSPDSIFGGAGSGVVISEDGLILTNAHVIAGAGNAISVRFNDGTTADATLIGGSTGDDIALIQADATDLTAATLGSSDDLRVGDDVVAIGNALGLGGDPSVTSGIVSAKDRSISDGNISLDDLIQTDAAINPGNSGGPLIDASGEVVGINTAIIQGAQNVGFSLAIDSVEELLEELKAGGGDLDSDQAVLGVSAVDVDSPDVTDELREEYGITVEEGALVTAVDPESAAADAGLEEGDVVTSLDNGAIASAEDLTSAVRSYQSGDVVSLVVQRKGERRTFEVTLGP